MMSFNKQFSCRKRQMVHVTEYCAKLLEVIENRTIRKLAYGFLFAFYNNGRAMYRFGDKARYWSKMAIFHDHCIR